MKYDLIFCEIENEQKQKEQRERFWMKKHIRNIKLYELDEWGKFWFYNKTFSQLLVNVLSKSKLRKSRAWNGLVEERVIKVTTHLQLAIKNKLLNSYKDSYNFYLVQQRHQQSID